MKFKFGMESSVELSVNKEVIKEPEYIIGTEAIDDNIFSINSMNLISGLESTLIELDMTFNVMGTEAETPRFITRIKEWFKRFWDLLTKAVTTVFNFIRGRSRNVKEKFTESIDKISRGVAQIKGKVVIPTVKYDHDWKVGEVFKLLDLNYKELKEAVDKLKDNPFLKINVSSNFNELAYMQYNYFARLMDCILVVDAMGLYIKHGNDGRFDKIVQYIHKHTNLLSATFNITGPEFYQRLMELEIPEVPDKNSIRFKKNDKIATIEVDPEEINTKEKLEDKVGVTIRSMELLVDFISFLADTIHDNSKKVQDIIFDKTITNSEINDNPEVEMKKEYLEAFKKLVKANHAFTITLINLASETTGYLIRFVKELQKSGADIYTTSNADVVDVENK